ncbi:MAG: hypothetical protein H6720_09305 [Sandaracinus sp.]|nr:hypothetical protein [Sandaracinus sp.]
MRVVVAAVVVWLLVSVARAQDPEAIEEARRAFEAGSTLVAQGELAAGTAELERSLALFPYLPTAFNLAVAYARADDTLRAADLLGAILEGRFGALDPERRADVERTLREAERTLAVIEVELVGGREGWVALDDAAPLPLTNGRARLRARPGSSVVTVGSEGEAPRRTALRLSAGAHERLRLVAGADRGTLVVRGPGEVEIVDVARGPSPLRRELAVGTYAVGRVDDPESRRQVTVEANLMREVDVSGAPRNLRRRRGWAVGVSLVVAAAAVGLAVGLSRGGGDDDSVFATFYALRRE